MKNYSHFNPTTASILTHEWKKFSFKNIVKMVTVLWFSYLKSTSDQK